MRWCRASAALSIETHHHCGGAAAGGAVDALARIIAEPMRSMLGQPIIIENLGGAGGTLAVGRVVRSAPDGYTLGLGTVGQYVISGAVYTLRFEGPVSVG